jgi:2-iminobutanoate/2-iminopropanoate deaminase
MISKSVVTCPQVPKAIGPYSTAIISGDFVFCSGQLPINPENNELAGPDAASQTRQCMNNIKAVLESAGTNLESVVKATIFLCDLNDFAQVNEVYASFFPSNPPARSTLGILALPRGAKLEIEVIARC